MAFRARAVLPFIVMPLLFRLAALAAELRRRRVYRVAAVYVVGTWVVIQFAETTFPYLGISDRSIGRLIVAAMIGFPVAVALGWVFDLSPGGVVRTEAADAGALPKPSAATPRRTRSSRVLLTSALLVVALLSGGWWWWAATETLSAEAPASIVVLPLANLSPSPDDAFLADGMTDEIIAQLSKISGLRVISRTSAMRYRGSDRSLPEIARELGVDAVVEGSVRRTGEDVRVTVQLVHGGADSAIWSDQFNRRSHDALRVQTDVAQQVAAALRIHVSGQERRRMRTRSTADPEAFEAYLRGRYFWNRRTGEGVGLAITELRKAIELDPDFALAYSGLADAYAALAQYSTQPPGEVMPMAREAALRALALDPDLPEAHASVGMIRFWYDWDWTAAEAAYRRALELNPSYATAAHWRALLMASLGRTPMALASIDQAEALDPVSPLIRTGRGIILYYARDYAGARTEILAALELDPEYPEALVQLAQVQTALGEYGEAIRLLEEIASRVERHPRALGPLGYAYARAGRLSEARAVAAELEERARSAYVPPTTVAIIHGALGDLDAMFLWLDRALEERDPFLTALRVHPAGDVARKDPRLQRLLGDLGLDS